LKLNQRVCCRDLYEWEQSRQAAQDNYKATTLQMHPVTATLLAKDLHLVWYLCVLYDFFAVGKVWERGRAAWCWGRYICPFAQYV